MVSFAVLCATAHAFLLLPQGGSPHEGADMELALLRDEYELARRYTQSLYADLREAEVQWRPTPKSSGIAWHLGHQAAVNHFLMRNLLAAEPSLNPQFDALFDAANPEENRGVLPSLAEILAYREAVASRTHTHVDALVRGGRPAAQQLACVIRPLLVSLINHEYQHDCWVREVRAMLGHHQADTVLSSRVRQVDGYWIFQWA
jgi:DinB superfamily